MQKTKITVAVFISILFLFITTTKADIRGAYIIFDDIGVRAPIEWTSWDRTTRHNYLKDLGAYPLTGSKYSGKVNIDKYFEYLGIEQPTGWKDWSTKKRIRFIDNIKNPAPVVTSVVPTEKALAQTPWIIIILSTIGTAVAYYAIQTTLNKNWHHPLEKIAYVATPLALIGLSLVSPYKETYTIFGKAAEIMLIYILFIKPVGVILNITVLKQQLGYRRHLGVMIFWFSLFHSFLYIYEKKLYDISYFYASITNPKFFALVSIIGMSILALTSNSYSVQKMKRNWKRIQYLSYPTLFAVLLHSSIVKDKIEKFIIIGIIFTILKIMEWKNVKFR